MELDKQISCVHASDFITTIPRFFYGPSKSQTMLYFANSGEDHIDPDRAFRKKDRTLRSLVSDHLMEGYTERLEAFLDNQTTVKKVTSEELQELNKLMDEVENA